MEGRGIPPGQPRPPSQVEEIAAKAARRTEGVQLRAFSHKAALPPLVSLGLSPDEHFVDAIEIVAGAPLPAKEAFMMDEDLKFAAAMTVNSRSKMKQLRDEATKAVSLLKHRWRSVTAKLEEMQPKVLGKLL